MSEIFKPERQVDFTKRNGITFNIHLLDIELVPNLDTVQAIAHLAIKAPIEVSDPKGELLESYMWMLYSPSIRKTPLRSEPVAHSEGSLVFLDRYQKPTTRDKQVYLSALFAANSFEFHDENLGRAEPETTASVYDFVLEIFDDGKLTIDNEGDKHLGL